MSRSSSLIPDDEFIRLFVSTKYRFEHRPEFDFRLDDGDAGTAIATVDDPQGSHEILRAIRKGGRGEPWLVTFSDHDDVTWRHPDLPAPLPTRCPPAPAAVPNALGLLPADYGFFVSTDPDSSPDDPDSDRDEYLFVVRKRFWYRHYCLQDVLDTGEFADWLPGCVGGEVCESKYDFAGPAEDLRQQMRAAGFHEIEPVEWFKEDAEEDDEDRRQLPDE